MMLETDYVDEIYRALNNLILKESDYKYKLDDSAKNYTFDLTGSGAPSGVKVFVVAEHRESKRQLNGWISLKPETLHDGFAQIKPKDDEYEDLYRKGGLSKKRAQFWLKNDRRYQEVSELNAADLEELVEYSEESARIVVLISTYRNNDLDDFYGSVRDQIKEILLKSA